MTTLANPETSQLLLINPVTPCLRQLDSALANRIPTQFDCLSLAAKEAIVPTTFAVSSDFAPRDFWLTKPYEKRTTRVYHYDRDRSIWSNPDLREAINTERRPQLYVCGFWIDDVVTAAAIEAQTYAFDTHIIIDLSPAYSRERWQPFVDRMMQYGVVPILLHTLLYEWMTNADGEGKRQILKALWQQNKKIDQQAVSSSRTGLS